MHGAYAVDERADFAHDVVYVKGGVLGLACGGGCLCISISTICSFTSEGSQIGSGGSGGLKVCDCKAPDTSL